MTIERDPDAILAAWLEDGPNRLPEATKRAIAVTTRSTHQTRRPMWMPWRFPTMNGTSRLALAAVAVVAVALGGLYLFNRSPDSGIGGQAPSPSPTATPMPFPTDTSGGVPVAPGTYALDMPARQAATGSAMLLRITFTVPAGWEKNRTPTTLWHAADHRTFGFFTVNNLYVDPCGPENVGLLDPQLGPTVDDLVAGLQRLPSLTWEGPRDVTVAGYAGKQLEVTAPTDLCASGMRLWASPESGPAPEAGVPIGPGDHLSLVVLDVDGARLVIAPDSSPDADLQGILDSVRIELLPVASDAPSPSPS